MEVRKYQGFRMQGTNKLPVLQKAEYLMTESMLTDHTWDASARTTLDYLTGNYTATDKMIFEVPELLTSLMESYLEHTEYGVAPLTAIRYATPENYTRFFLDEFAKLGPVSVQPVTPDTLNDKLRNMTEEEWGLLQPLLRNIPSYSEWANAPSLVVPATPLPELDNAERARKALEATRVQAKEKFMEWFDDKLELSQFLRWDRDFPTLYKNHVEERLDRILNSSSNATDLRNNVEKFSKFATVEYYFYTRCLDEKAYHRAKDVKASIDFVFWSLSWPNDTPEDYAKKLKTLHVFSTFEIDALNRLLDLIRFVL